MGLQRLKLNMRGINEVLTSPGVQAHVDQVGQRIARAAGDGFEYQRRPHPFTSRGYVSTTTPEARRAEAERNVLLGALAAGRAG